MRAYASPPEGVTVAGLIRHLLYHGPAQCNPMPFGKYPEWILGPLGKPSNRLHQRAEDVVKAISSSKSHGYVNEFSNDVHF